MKIYTRTGDGGATTLFDGTRIAKSDPRVDAYGEVDEANAVIGLVRSEGLDREIDDLLGQVQRDLFALGSRLADPAERIADRVTKIALGPEDVTRLEQAIDRFEEELEPLRRFILPGGTRAAAALHLARTVCRRAERRMVALAVLEVEFLAYMNRLSDLLFVLARVVNHRAGVAEAEW
ncbi:MAG: cob(I)yrinic acid a,c-diamide adenosyltransferase [Acidobacteria bacterium]|nr:cob(I)yrinic acid a,c-diamide adenosyltransferase [Acidobacteriota bacterium]